MGLLLLQLGLTYYPLKYLTKSSIDHAVEQPQHTSTTLSLDGAHRLSLEESDKIPRPRAPPHLTTEYGMGCRGVVDLHPNAP